VDKLFSVSARALARGRGITRPGVALGAALALWLCAPSARAELLLQGVRQVAVGGSHACALLADGNVACWGNNASGQVGQPLDDLPPSADAPAGIVVIEPFPRIVPGLTAPGISVTAIAVGASHSCARRSDAQVWCWGSNSANQLGRTSVGSSTPAPVLANDDSPLAAVNAIAAGAEHSCAIVGANNTLYCWGSNVGGQLGNNTTNPRTRAAAVLSAPGGPVFSGVGNVATGMASSCALLVTGLFTGEVRCWGGNVGGELGSGDLNPYLTPRKITAFQAFGSLSLGAGHACAALFSGGYCWGDNSSGQLGQGAAGSPVLNPAAVATPLAFQSVASGYLHNCAVRSDATVACWGGNSVGQLGDGTTDSRSSPTAVAGLRGVRQVSANPIGGTTCVVAGSKTDGSDAAVLCWGSNGGGVLGNGTDPQAAAVRPGYVGDRLFRDGLD
jgi:alpha-tubulin suppressor-like RCC1 family protein